MEKELKIGNGFFRNLGIPISATIVCFQNAYRLSSFGRSVEVFLKTRDPLAYCIFSHNREESEDQCAGCTHCLSYDGLSNYVTLRLDDWLTDIEIY